MDHMPAETTEPKILPEGPGTMLRRAREDLRLAPDNVASILRLSAKQIQMLEEDDYAGLPGPTYIRGYLRSYAQLLGLSPDRVIDVYQQYCRLTAPPPPETPTPPPAAQKAAESAQLTRLAAIVAGAVILLLVVFWWKGRDDAATVARKPDPDTTTYVTESGAVIRDPAAVSAANEPAPVAAPGAGEPAKPGAAAPAASKPAPAAPVAAAPAPAAATPPAPVAEGPRGRLVLRATQESWADVRDARQGRLLYETLAPGRVVTLEGASPLSVFLGNADGVQVEFNGRPVDVNRHKRGQLARFTLGEEPPAPPPPR
jgi:cytoskeleton protein RodZ